MRGDAVIVVLAVGLFSAAMNASAGGVARALPAFVALLLWAILRRSFPAIHVALFALLWAVTAGLFPWSRVWPTKLLAPLVLYAFVVVLLSPLRGSAGWVRVGRLSPGVWAWISVIVTVSSAALVAWAALTAPDLSNHLANIPDIPRWTYPLAAVIFAAFNAALEEAIFRGIVMQALDDTLGASHAAVFLQAVSFGAAHYVGGFPDGALGFAMTFAYGAMLGALRRKSRGLLAPWIAHVAADLTIFAILTAVTAC